MQNNNLKLKMLSLYRLSKYMRYGSMIGASRAGLSMEIVNEAKPSRLLIMAPHPDDEVFGCGGLLIKHRLVGSEIRLVYLSDGEKENGRPADKKLSKRRREEAERAAEALGAETAFSELRDGRIDEAVVAKITINQIKEFQPDTILLPIEFDDHSDHRATAAGVKKALSVIGKQDNAMPDISIMFYEIWTPLYPNRIVTIDAEAKNKLISNYKSQLEVRDYDKAILGLNDYRGYITGAGSPAEAFFAIPAKLWLKLKS